MPFFSPEGFQEPQNKQNEKQNFLGNKLIIDINETSN